ncbi:MAG: twin-arginine translocation signal domain-containing protein [Burkholderiales bacterium]|nr:twin-arginine translocation signal domain-containing protein [Burkholderiales bacterium]
MTERTKRLSRRNFLFAVGAGGAVTAGAMVANNAAKAQPAFDNDDDKRARRGYHASRHVNDYYRTARI